MKKIANKVFKTLYGKPGLMTEPEGDVPMTTQRAIMPHFVNDNTTGSEAIKVFDLGCKIARLPDDTEFIIVEDAEFEILKRVCDPPQGAIRGFGSTVYGQLERVLFEAKDYTLPEVVAAKGEEIE